VGIENPVHLLFIAIVALIVLGPKRLPELARALGHGIREFREAIGQQGESRLEPTLAREESVAVPDPAAPTPAPPTSDPPRPVGSPDAPDRRPL
jgi:TatA/E family protein of Tat protein translocase